MASVLHQQMTSRCKDTIPRNGEISPSPCDRHEKTETVLPFTPRSGPHQLSVEASRSKAGRFKSTVEMGN